MFPFDDVIMFKEIHHQQANFNLMEIHILTLEEPRDFIVRFEWHHLVKVGDQVE